VAASDLRQLWPTEAGAWPSAFQVALAFQHGESLSVATLPSCPPTASSNCRPPERASALEKSIDWIEHGDSAQRTLAAAPADAVVMIAYDYTGQCRTGSALELRWRTRESMHPAGKCHPSRRLVPRRPKNYHRHDVQPRDGARGRGEEAIAPGDAALLRAGSSLRRM
jgi:hypothetical protein